MLQRFARLDVEVEMAFLRLSAVVYLHAI